jgi:hypothetical protein
VTGTSWTERAHHGHLPPPRRWLGRATVTWRLVLLGPRHVRPRGAGLRCTVPSSASPCHVIPRGTPGRRGIADVRDGPEAPKECPPPRPSINTQIHPDDRTERRQRRCTARRRFTTPIKAFIPACDHPDRMTFRISRVANIVGCPESREESRAPFSRISRSRNGRPVGRPRVQRCRARATACSSRRPTVSTRSSCSSSRHRPASPSWCRSATAGCSSRRSRSTAGRRRSWPTTWRRRRGRA